MNGQRLTFITTLGALNCPQTSDANNANQINASQNVQVCSIWTTATIDDPPVNGTATVTLSGAEREGTATVTVTHGSLDPATAEVTMFGDAKNLAAEVEQSSVEVGGSVLVVLTVTDGAGNPVSDAQPQPAAKDAVVGPDKDSNKVTTSQARDDDDDATSPYNVNKDVDGDGVVDKGDIPACGPVTAVPANPADDEVVPMFVSMGTNDAGQCVVEVNATPDDTTTSTNDASTRGVHTLNFVLAKLTASAEIEVAGAASAIETDPADGSYVGSLSDTSITVTVRDDEGVLVGATPVQVRRLEGGGLVEGKATGADGTMTDNGQTTVTYTAPSRDGVVTFVIDAGSGTAAIRTTLTLNIGEEPVVEPEVVEPEVVEPEVVEPEVVEPVEPEVVEPEEPEVVEPVEPEVMVDPTLNPAAAGSVTLAVFSGGSVEQLKAALSECGSDVAAHATGDDGWVSYVPAAVIPAANAPFNAAFADGIPAGQILQITSCN